MLLSVGCDFLNTKQQLVNKIILVSLLYLIIGSWSTPIHAQCSGDSILVHDTLVIDHTKTSNLSTLMVHAKGVKSVKLLVYSRRGSKVFESTSSVIGAHTARYKTIDTGWDGTRLGQPLKEDLYVFMLEAQCVDHQTIYKSGTVQLLRTAATAPENVSSP